MKQLLATILTTLLMMLNTAAEAQIPPVRHKPIPLQKQDTLQQVIGATVADYEISKDRKNERVVYKGIFTYRDLEQEPTFSWLPKGMDEYKPNADAVAYLRNNLTHYKLLVFMGTWCGDSHDLLPRLYKILADLNISYENIMLVGMDRDKTTTTKTGKKLVKKYKVSLLPTIVILNDENEEAGRITESVNKSMEEDLVQIMKASK